MKIFLVGATGRTGRWILQAALARGHEVTVLVRERPERISLASPHLRIVTGDVLRPETWRATLPGHDAVISALSSETVAAGMRHLIEAAEAGGVRRLLGVAGGGILQWDETRLRRDRPGYPALFRQTSEQHWQAWQALEASPLDWTLLCTPDLPEGPATGRAHALPDRMPEGGRAVPTGDVAEFLLDELEQGKFLRRRVGFTV